MQVITSRPTKPLPASFARDGFVLPQTLRKRRRLMIGTDGRTNTGKTEFILSIPGPGIAVVLDRGFDSMLDNPTPPPTRRADWAFKVVSAPTAGQAVQNEYVEHWKEFRTVFYRALDNPDANAVALDGDADSWELQKLAEYGKLTGIFPQTRYGSVNYSRRAFINRAWESGKIIIATNRVADGYVEVRDARGQVVMGDDKQPVRVKSGEVDRKGFPDQDYLWQLQIRHLYAPPAYNQTLKKTVPAKWGLRILKCKANTQHEGTELWGQDCNFEGLVSLIYPQVALSEWGF